MPGQPHAPEPRAVPSAIRRIEDVMGTVVGVDIRQTTSADLIGTALVDPVLDVFFATLRDIEARFSPFLPDSEISRIAAGRLPEAEASHEVRFVLAACDHLAETSAGAFD